MNSVPLAFAALALAGAVPASAATVAPDLNTALNEGRTSAQTTTKPHALANAPAEAKTSTKAKNAAKAPAKTADAEQSGATEKPDAADKALEFSPAFSEPAALVSRWIAASNDNGTLPYIIVDKPSARAYLFDATGKPLADAPVLIGKALGDEATPGIGAKSLSEIGPAEKTTPAGRFLAKFGLAAGNQKVLWVDYTTSVALHTIPVGNKENRRARMLSKTIDDNRITFGCINVPKAFYNNGVVPLFEKKGGYVYVLPDSKALEDVFPRVRVQTVLESAQN